MCCHRLGISGSLPVDKFADFDLSAKIKCHIPGVGGSHPAYKMYVPLRGFYPLGGLERYDGYPGNYRAVLGATRMATDRERGII